MTRQDVVNRVLAELLDWVAADRKATVTIPALDELADAIYDALGGCTEDVREDEERTT